MYPRNAMIGIGLGAAVLLLTGAANAAPMTSVAPPTTMAEQAALHCWISHGVRHCRSSRYYGYRWHSYGNPDALRTGSNRWWRAMQREDRTRN
jgi:hypothetical protein